jgi:hypothetical protein
MSNDYNSNAKVRVTNNCKQLATITLTWKYSDDSEHTSGAMKVGQGEDSQYSSVGYNTGFGRTGGSWWKIEVEVADKKYINDPDTGPFGEDGWYRCDLKSEDDKNHLTFSVSEEEFVMNMYGGCRVNMVKA